MFLLGGIIVLGLQLIYLKKLFLNFLIKLIQIYFGWFNFEAGLRISQNLFSKTMIRVFLSALRHSSFCLYLFVFFH